MLLVDAAQGIEAQTLANLYLAIEADLAIIPVINKIDLPAAQPDRVAREIEQVLGTPASEMLRVSAKTGEGARACWRRSSSVCRRPPATPRPRPGRWCSTPVRPLPGRDRVRADGRRAAGQGRPAADDGRRARLGGRGGRGVRPEAVPTAELQAGEVGYLIPGSRTCARSGWGHRDDGGPGVQPLPGYREPRPMVFSGCTRSRATTSPTCVTPWTGCGSTTPPSSTSPSRRPRSGSGSAAASLGCSTWTSSASGWSGSSTSR